MKVWEWETGNTNCSKSTDYFLRELLPRTLNILSQIMELAGLKNELRHLLVIAQQLEPYIRSISSLMERIQPQVGASQEEVEEEEAVPVRDYEAPAISIRNSETFQSTNKGKESPLPGRVSEDERMMAVLERIQTMKPDYKQR